MDDNLIGTRRDHLAYSKDLFRAMIRERLTRPWICQATINFADDDELLDLASRSGCQGVFIGFESPTVEGLMAVARSSTSRRGETSARPSAGFNGTACALWALSLSGSTRTSGGLARAIARAAKEYGIDAANVLILTPLPGTKLYAQMEREGRIRSNDYPQDWKYYTLTYPVANYAHLTWTELIEEVNRFNDRFYPYPQILRRMLQLARNTRNPRTFFVALVANLSYDPTTFSTGEFMPAGPVWETHARRKWVSRRCLSRKLRSLLPAAG